MYNREFWFESPTQAAITTRAGNGLSGYLGATPMLAVEMPDETMRFFYGIGADLDAALNAGGRPQRPYAGMTTPQAGMAPNGYYSVQKFQGGWLLDNCPLNVIFGQGWIAGQQQALQAAGLNPTCPQVMPAVVPSAQPATAPLPAVTGTSINAPVFTSTGTGVINYGGTTTAPTTTAVSASGAPAPPPVTGLGPIDMGAVPQASTFPSWLPLAAIAALVLIATRR